MSLGVKNEWIGGITERREEFQFSSFLVLYQNLSVLLCR